MLTLYFCVSKKGTVHKDHSLVVLHVSFYGIFSPYSIGRGKLPKNMERLREISGEAKEEKVE